MPLYSQDFPVILLLTEKRESSGSKGKGTFHANVLDYSQCHKHRGEKFPFSLIFFNMEGQVLPCCKVQVICYYVGELG